MEWLPATVRVQQPATVVSVCAGALCMRAAVWFRLRVVGLRVWARPPARLHWLQRRCLHEKIYDNFVCLLCLLVCNSCVDLQAADAHSNEQMPKFAMTAKPVWGSATLLKVLHSHMGGWA